MSHVTCKRCGEDNPSIDGRLSFAGEFGERIRGAVCQPCWNAWLDVQTKVINEYRLHMGEPEHRRALADAAKGFFGFEDAKRAEDAQKTE